MSLHSDQWPKSKDQPSSSTINRWMLYYKGIYVLNNVCNKAFGTILFPVIKLIVILAIIFSFFTYVRLFKYLDLVYFLFVACCMLASLITLVPSSLVMSSLYTISQNFSKNLTSRLNFTAKKKTMKILKQQLKSCPLVRCQIGNLYHMEGKAKLTLIHQVVTGIVFLLVNTEVQ